MRSLLLTALFRSIRALPGVGPKVAEHIKRLTGGERILDMLMHAPIDLIDRRYQPKAAQAVSDKIATLSLTVVRHIPNARKSSPYRIEAEDHTDCVSLVFFHARRPYLEERFPVGKEVIVSGKIDRSYGKIQMMHPELLSGSEDQDIEWVEPIYPMTAGLSPKTYRKALRASFESIPDLPEWLGADLIKREGFSGWKESLLTLHGPETARDIDPQGTVRKRLALDEMLAQQLALRLVRKANIRPSGQVFEVNTDLRAKVLSAFPYDLTSAQNRVLSEIDADMSSPLQMLRLLQGDVGSGKTIVALAAACNAISSGRQVALMAPTEILARQHYETILPLAEAAGISCAILTGRDKGKARAEILARIASGEAMLVMGTHALFQKDVEFSQLGFVIIDEQHRFGVQQRAALADKGVEADILVMTATPIPRSLTLAVYGDMDCSRLDEKPPGRKPVDTRLLSLDRLGNVIEAIGRKIKDGERVYWVCPLVEESEVLDLAAAEDRALILRQIFGEERVGLVHGLMKAEEKDTVMADFSSGAIDILIATTVIEVGVNVPEATVMVIEHAERFGLSQLHQLRGRVGRGDKGASCLLLYHPKIGETARERLSVMRATEDGFIIAEKDLEIRGAGDLLGTAQSGLPIMRFADLEQHSALLQIARDYADYILEKDPSLKTPQGEALRILLYLFERDKAITYLRSG